MKKWCGMFLSMNFIFGWHFTIFEVFLRSFQQNRWIKSSTLTRCHPLTKKATTSFLTVSLSLSLSLFSHLTHTQTHTFHSSSHIFSSSRSLFLYSYSHLYTPFHSSSFFTHTFFSLSLILLVLMYLMKCIYPSILCNPTYCGLTSRFSSMMVPDWFHKRGAPSYFGCTTIPPHFLFPSQC